MGGRTAEGRCFFLDKAIGGRFDGCHVTLRMRFVCVGTAARCAHAEGSCGGRI